MTILILTLLIIFTSFISGIFGMAGGMILMGALGLMLSVPAAMIVHGAAQFSSNGFRAWSLRKDIYWKSIGAYLAGAFLAMFALWLLNYVPPKSVMFIVMGALPFLFYLPGLKNLDFQNLNHAALCGFSVTAIQLSAGVGGPALDVFFARSKMNRFQILSTKAITQAISHLLKIVYFIPFLDQANKEVPFHWYPLFVIAAFAGTTFGLGIVRKLSDVQFQTITRRILVVIGIVYLIKGVSLL